MSLESAIKIFTDQGFKDPQWAVATIQKARTLEELSQIMRDEHTCLSADQFVYFRIRGLFKGDPDFAKGTLETAREKFRNLGVPEQIVDYYISEGGGVDTSIVINFKISFGELPQVDNKDKLHEFYDAAKAYLLNALRNYVNTS